MTKLSGGKPLVRETALLYRGRPLIVELHPGFLVVRRKGIQQRLSVDYYALYEVAMKIEALSMIGTDRKKGRG